MGLPMNDTDRKAHRPASTRMPRRVEFSVAAAALLLVAVAVLHLTGNGFMDHGASAAAPEPPAP